MRKKYIWRLMPSYEIRCFEVDPESIRTYTYNDFDLMGTKLDGDCVQGYGSLGEAIRAANRKINKAELNANNTLLNAKKHRLALNNSVEFHTRPDDSQ